MDGILNCDVFVVEGRDLRYGVICMLCAGEVVGIANVSRTGSSVSHLVIH